MGKLKEATVRMIEIRDHASRSAIEAIRGIEKTLREDLMGQGLRGLPNLGHSSTHPYRGIQVRTKRVAEPLQRPRSGKVWGREALVFNLQGALAFVRIDGMGNFEERAALDSELNAGDLEDIGEAFEVLVNLHCAAVERRIGDLERIQSLARAIVSHFES